MVNAQTQAPEEDFDLDNMKHNSAESIAEKWADKHAKSAGWSDEAVMAWAYQDLRRRFEALATRAQPLPAQPKVTQEEREFLEACEFTTAEIDSIDALPLPAAPSEEV